MIISFHDKLKRSLGGLSDFDLTILSQTSETEGCGDLVSFQLEQDSSDTWAERSLDALNRLAEMGLVTISGNSAWKTKRGIAVNNSRWAGHIPSPEEAAYALDIADYMSPGAEIEPDGCLFPGRPASWISQALKSIDIRKLHLVCDEFPETGDERCAAVFLASCIHEGIRQGYAILPVPPARFMQELRQDVDAMTGTAQLTAAFLLTIHDHDYGQAMGAVAETCEIALQAADMNSRLAAKAAEMCGSIRASEILGDWRGIDGAKLVRTTAEAISDRSAVEFFYRTLITAVTISSTIDIKSKYSLKPSISAISHSSPPISYT